MKRNAHVVGRLVAMALCVTWARPGTAAIFCEKKSGVASVDTQNRPMSDT